MAQEAFVSGVARVVLKGTAAGRNVNNVFHVQNGGMQTGTRYTQAAIDQLVASTGDFFKTHFGPHMGNSYQFQEAFAVDLTDDLGVQGIHPLSGTGTGGTDTNISIATACCISWKINRHYRGGHPRTYLGPLGSVALLNQTTFTTTFVAAVQADAVGFLNAVNGLSIAGLPQFLVALHRVKNGAQLGSPTTDGIVTAEVDSRIDTQRRRLGPDR